MLLMKISAGSAENLVPIRYRTLCFGQGSVLPEHTLFMLGASRKNAAEHMRLSPINKDKSS